MADYFTSNPWAACLNEHCTLQSTPVWDGRCDVWSLPGVWLQQDHIQLPKYEWLQLRACCFSCCQVCMLAVAQLALTILGPRLQRQHLENVLPIVGGQQLKKGEWKSPEPLIASAWVGTWSCLISFYLLGEKLSVDDGLGRGDICWSWIQSTIAT